MEGPEEEVKPEIDVKHEVDKWEDFGDHCIYSF